MLVVTGPTGNVGADLARALAEREPGTYRLLGHHPERIREELGQHVPVTRFAYDDRSTWPAALDGIERLFLLFPLPRPKTAKAWIAPFVEAAAAAGARHVVYVSVPGADRMKVNPHYRTERAIEASGTSWTFLRCAYFMQNLHRSISTHGVDIAENDEIFLPAGSGQTSFLDARDVADAALRILDDPSSHRDTAYTFGGPDVLDFDQAAAILSEVLGRPIRYARPSFPAFWRRLRSRGVTWDTVAFMTIVYTLARRGRNVVERSDLEQVIGRPGTDFRTWAAVTKWRWDTQTWT